MRTLRFASHRRLTAGTSRLEAAEISDRAACCVILRTWPYPPQRIVTFWEGLARVGARAGPPARSSRPHVAPTGSTRLAAGSVENNGSHVRGASLLTTKDQHVTVRVAHLELPVAIRLPLQRHLDE